MDYETPAAARAAALGECGAGCSVVLTFNRCGAYAADQDAGSRAESYDSATSARQAALAECASRGGAGCKDRVWGCNGQVIEEGLNLDRAARRQIQQALRAVGYDPGSADGCSRTRAAMVPQAVDPAVQAVDRGRAAAGQTPHLRHHPR